MVSHLSICDYLSSDLKMMELRRMKGSIMAQWINLVSAFIVLKSGPIYLVLVGLTAGKLAVYQARSLSDKKLVVLEFFKIQ